MRPCQYPYCGGVPKPATSVDDAPVFVKGPWNHRIVNANGSNFHIVEAGKGPLVILLHGFPEFWWTWRYQIPELARAGYRVVAMDMRGYGGSDKPPRGYDMYTLVSDVTGLTKALGEHEARLIGHDWGGVVAWSAAVLAPTMVRGLAVLGSAHPLRLRQALATDRHQISASRYIFASQIPRFEHRLTAHDAAYIADLYDLWAGPAWAASAEFREHVAACRKIIQVQQAAFCATEYYRWAVRSLTRRSGWRYANAMARPVDIDALHLHGTLDRCILPATARGAQRQTSARLEYQQLDGVGHFPHLEAPEHVNTELVGWLNARS